MTTLFDLLEGDPDAPAVYLKGAVTTRGELLYRAELVAANLRARNLEHHAVGVCLPNGPEAIASWFGIWHAGATLVPLNPRVPEAERSRAVAATGIGAVIDVDGVHAVDGGREAGSDVAIIQFTSGTTGAPKAVPLLHETIQKLLDSVIGSLRGERTAKARMPNIVPLSLSLWAGIYQVLFAYTLGVPVVLMDQFHGPEFARLVREYGIRSSVLPPAALVTLLHDPAIDTLEPLRYVRSVSAPLSPAHARKFHDRFGIAILNGYGQTELGGEAVGWSADDWKQYGDQKLGSVGRPHDAFSVRIAGDDEIGELEIHSTQALPPEDAAMEGRITADGWLRTGDLARIDAEGFVWIEGRVSAMINRGGLKVFPDEVEEQMRAYPGVTDVAVAGVPDDRLGEVPWAFVVPDAGAAIDVEALREWCREQIAPYKIPAGITIVADLPRNDAGKVLRQELVAGR